MTKRDVRIAYRSETVEIEVKSPCTQTRPRVRSPIPTYAESQE